MPRTQSQAEIIAHFDEQVGLLEKSCHEYDAGDSREIRRIALALRVLLHDTRRSRSLLGLVGAKDLLFFDTAYDIDPRNLLPDFALVVMPMMGVASRYMAPAWQTPTHPTWIVPFENWWEKVVIRVPEQFKLTRRDLVLTMADQDGGAHVDPSLEDNYYALSREGAGAFTFVNYGAEHDGKPVMGVAEASVRQIAQEVLITLVNGLRMIPADLPADLPEEEWRRVERLEVGPDGVARRPNRERRNLCSCHSGLVYRECHMRGGINEGKIIPPVYPELP